MATKKTDKEQWEEADLSFVDAVEWLDKGQEIQGVLKEINIVGNLDSRMMTLATEQGNMGVWESAQLVKFFNQCEKHLQDDGGRDLTVKIVYQGKEKLKSGRTGNKFQVFTRLG